MKALEKNLSCVHIHLCTVIDHVPLRVYGLETGAGGGTAGGGNGGGGGGGIGYLSTYAQHHYKFRF